MWVRSCNVSMTCIILKRRKGRAPAGFCAVVVEKKLEKVPGDRSSGWTQSSAFPFQCYFLSISFPFHFQYFQWKYQRVSGNGNEWKWKYLFPAWRFYFLSTGNSLVLGPQTFPVFPFPLESNWNKLFPISFPLEISCNTGNNWKFSSYFQGGVTPLGFPARGSCSKTADLGPPKPLSFEGFTQGKFRREMGCHARRCCALSVEWSTWIRTRLYFQIHTSRNVCCDVS